MQKLNKLLNITSTEWPRIIVAWSINFLLRFGFILGWTIIIATYLNRVGITYLPLLFLGNAALVMLGTMIYRLFIHKVRREVLISFSVLFASILLIGSLFFVNSNTPLYIGFLILTEAVILSQVYILVSLFYEELFTPLESQRTFPIIESAEIFGTLVGGLTLSIYGSGLSSYKFIAIWAISLILILPIVLMFNSKTMDIPKLQTEEDLLKNLRRNTLEKHISQIKQIPFLKGLMWIVFINWGIMNIIEFQYTKAIQAEVVKSSQILGSVFEGDISQKLGSLHVIFSSGALIIQLLMASRIIGSLGIVSSMLLHPIVTFLNAIIIALRYGFVTSSITRGTFELTNLIFTNAYNSSYYAIPHKFRDDAKELIQGIVKPLGAMAGTMLILIVVSSFESALGTYILNMILIFLSICMAVMTSDLGKKYTDMTEQNLSHKLDIHTRINAVEILGQNGHGRFPASLQKILKRENEASILKEKILYTIGKRQDTESISTVIEMLGHEEEIIRSAAVKTIMEFHSLEKKLFDQAFTRFYTIENLMRAIEKEENEFVREDLVKALYKITPEATTKFLIESIRKDSTYRVEFIKLMTLFKDPNLMHFLEPFLNEKKPKVRAACIIALWQFKKTRQTLSHHLHQLLNSKNKDSVLAGIEAAGIIKNTKTQSELMRFLNSKDKAIHEASLLALARHEQEKVIKKLVEKLSDFEHPWHKIKNYILESLSRKYRESVNTSMTLHIIELINKILKNHSAEMVDSMDKKTLKELLKLYRQIDAHQECYKIEAILDKI